MKKQNSLVIAAVSGMLLGLMGGCKSSKSAETDTTASGAAATQPAEEETEGGEAKHACKGLNDCKGQGGCAVEGKHACKGQNECKGQGGCRTL